MVAGFAEVIEGKEFWLRGLDLNQRLSDNGRLLGRQTLYCLSGLNADPMLVRKRGNLLFPRSGCTDLMAPVPSCCRVKPYSPKR
jgi:hypothetical protein